MLGADRTDETATLLSRLELLNRLCQSPAHTRDIIDETGQSRSTVHRAVNELTDLGLVHRVEDGIVATLAGRLVRDQLTAYLDGLDDILTARAVLDPLPVDTDLEYDILDGAEGVLAKDPAPYRPADRFHEALSEATDCRFLLPTVDESRTVRVLYEHVVTHGNSAELVVSEDVFRTLRNEFPRRMALLAEVEHFSLLVGEVPPYTLALLDGESTTREPTATLVVHNDNGGVHGVLVNETELGVAWATTQYEQYRHEATDRVAELTADTDGGMQTANGYTAPTIGQSLPVSLEQEGFVRIDTSYFQNQPVAKPATAWRAGLSLTEVHAGYAISRPASETSDPPIDDDLTLDSTVTNTLVAGGNVALLGPPGSGKSTVCKQVACEWYGAGRGPVIYRESDRGTAFGATERLHATCDTAEGHTLVVVEDAVRPDANAVFEVLEELAARDDVSVLLDSREHEWNTYVSESVAFSAVDVLHVPPMTLTDCEHLVEHFERTIDRPVDVPADELWSRICEGAPPNAENAPHEMVRLIYRLSTYAGPLAEGPTALEESVASLYGSVADDEVALSVCILAHTLNAAGIGVERALLYAGADIDEFDAVDATIERLEGTILFPQGGGRYRTVHEEWSKTFLVHLRERDEITRQFGAVVTALLALADDAEKRSAIEAHLTDDVVTMLTDDVVTMSIGDEPTTWADETVEAIYRIAGERSGCAPMFGDGASDAIELPSSCSDDVARDRLVWLGQAFLSGSYYDRAQRSFERISHESDTNARLLGLGRIAHRRGEYQEAVTYHERGISIASEHDNQMAKARHLNGLGLATWRRGSYEQAREYFETCHELARELGNRHLESKANANLGAIAWSQGRYDRAADHFGTFLDGARSTGNRHGQAKSLNNLGTIAFHRGAYDRARAQFEESLTIRRTIGYRSGEASCLNNLGLTAARQGNTKGAQAFHESALEISEEINYARERGHSLWGLGVVARKRAEYDAAESFFEQALAVFTETGNQSYRARTKLERAILAFSRGHISVAYEQAEQLLETVEDLDERHLRGRCRKLLGRVVAANGDLEEATEHWEAAVTVFEASDSADLALQTLEHLVERCVENGDTRAARRFHERATELLADAPDATVTLHQEWVSEYDERLRRQ